MKLFQDAARPAVSVLPLALVLALTLGVSGCGKDSPASLLASGKQYLEKREASSAVIQFKAALQQTPQSGETRFLLGRALMENSDPVSAAVELSKALDLRHPEAEVLPLLARAMLLIGDNKKLTNLYGAVELPDKAALASLKSSVASAWGALGDRAKTEAAVQAALTAVPDYGPALVLRARIVAGAGDFASALALVEQVLAKDPGLYEAWNLKGEILLLAKNDPKAAELAFRKTIDIEKAHLAAHTSLIGIRMRERDVPGMKKQVQELKGVLPRHPQTVFVEAQLAFLERDYKKAREFSQLLLRGAPDNVTVILLAGAIEGQSGSLVQAETHFSKALQINPNLMLARRNLAHAYLRMGQPEKALHALQPLLEGDEASAEIFAVAADAHLQMNEPVKAEALFVRASKIDPTDPRVRTALALTHLTRGDAALAFSELERVAAEDKGTYAEMAIVSARLKRNENDAALKAVHSMVSKQPDSALAVNTRGRIHMARKDYPAARLDFDKALVLDKSFFPAITSLAALDMVEKKPEQAIKRFEDLLKTEPNNHQAYMALAEIRGRSGAGRDEVAKLLLESIKAAPSEAAPRLMLIEIHLKAKNLKEAMAAAQDAVAAMPNDVNVLDALGRIQMEAGNQQQATGTFRRLINLDPKATLPLLRLADIYTATRDRKSAQASLTRALELQPDLEPAQRALLQLLMADNRPREALDIAKRMQRQRPGDAVGYLFEGTIQQRLKAPDAAITAYRSGLKELPANSELATRLHRALISAGRAPEAARHATAWTTDHPDDMLFEYQLATAAISMGDLPQAETRLKKVVERAPDNALALNNLAWTMTVLGKPGAAAHAERAVGLLPNRPTLIDTFAMALLAEGNVARALEMQKKAVELAPDDLNLRLNLAKIAIKGGDKILARTELDRLAKEGKRFALQDQVASMSKSL